MMDWINSLIGPVDLALFAPRWAAVLLDATLKSLVILAIGGIVVVAMRSASAAARHAVWALALGGILLLPLLSALLPRWDLAMIPTISLELPTETLAESGSHGIDHGAAVVAPVSSVSPGAPAPEPDVTESDTPTDLGLEPWLVTSRTPPANATRTAEARWGRSGTLPLVVLWGLGAGLVLAVLVTGLVRATRIARTAASVSGSDWLHLGSRLCRRMGIRRPVALLRNETTSTPATLGVFRPVVLLPAASEQWPLERRRDVLIHELAHIKRYDFLTQIIAQYACAVFWFNPLIWLVARQMRVERERACDDEVLRAGTKPSVYAGHLLEIARSVRPFSITHVSAVAMAQRSQLSGRLFAILEDGRNRGSVSRSGALALWVIAFVFLIPVASATTVRERASDIGTVEPVVVDPGVSGTVVGAAAIGVRVRQVPQERRWASAPQCREADGDGESRGTNENENDDRRTSRWWDEGCEGEVDIRGDIRFTSDYADILSVSRGGRFTIEIDADGDSRRVEVRQNGGSLQRRWFVNGREDTYGAEAEAWFPRALQDFFHHSSYDLDGRVDYLLASGGVPALLAQAESSHGQYLARRFYAAAIESGDLGPAQIADVLQRATQDVTSDFEMARLLRAIPANDLQDANLRRQYVQASNTIESDFEKARVLRSLLQQTGLEPDVIRMLLESAPDIQSDFELARLLRTIGPRYLTDPDARDLYLEAANGIESDFELQRVLASLLDIENLSSQNLRLLLTSATHIESDFESARLLMRVADKFGVDDSFRQVFFESVHGIESDFERQRVLTTLARQDGLSNAVVADAIREAIGINGDFAKANVLRAFANNYGGDADVRRQLEEAAETLSSDHEYGRVMSALRGRRT